jgi:hypothetical protein
MNYSNRKEYGEGLADMLNWTQTTFLRGQYKFNDSYVDKICNRLVGSMLIQGVFASVEKDRNEEHNHVHLLLASKYRLNRYELAKLSGFNPIGIGNVNNVKNKTGVSKYVAKHIGKDFSYHNIYV